MVTFYSCEKGYPTPEAWRVNKPGKKRKSPSDVARSRRRREAWMKAKESAVPEISTPAHCSRTRPFIPISSRRHQISDIPQLDGELLTMENQNAAQSVDNSQQSVIPGETLAQEPLIREPLAQEPLTTETLQEEPPLPPPLEHISDPNETSCTPSAQPDSSPQFNPPPTPPPMLPILPSCWRWVICKECLRDTHNYSYYHCMNCHKYGSDWYKRLNSS